MDKILLAREERITIIKNFGFESPIIVIKANIPGADKNIKEAFVLTRIFKKILKSKLNIISEYFYESLDGPYYLIISSNTDANKIKLMLIDLEDTHYLGRFIDLDVYTDSKSLSRKDFNQEPRKCYLCHQEVFLCSRESNHSTSELLQYISLNLDEYLGRNIRMYLERSFKIELDLDPKFGLVTPFSNGSHKDMDYLLMRKAYTTIIPYLAEMFIQGYTLDLNLAFKISREIGLIAEASMFESTEGVNAYKGAIFIVGLVCVSLGYILQTNSKKEKIYSLITDMCKNLASEFKDKPTTDGLKVYHKYGFGGAREEAILGLPTVKKTISFLDQYANLDNEALHMALINIIINTKDTVMIKRSKTLERYQSFIKILAEIEKYNYNQIAKITEYFITENISCGGSADLLIASVFIKLIFDDLID